MAAGSPRLRPPRALVPLRAALVATLLLALTGVRPASAQVQVRVLAYNIHHGEGRDGRLDLERLAGIIASVQPDLVALQEVDRGTERAGRVDQLAELAARLGMHATFGKTLDYQGGEYGVAVLSRWPVFGVENRSLPSSLDHEPRSALTVRVRVGEGGPVIRFTSTHFDHSREPNDRLDQATAVDLLLAADQLEPDILAGDLNARVDTDVLALLLRAGWTNTVSAPPPAPVPPAAGPPGSGPPGQGPGRGRGGGPRGDYVLVRPAARLRVVEARLIDETVASDHRPVFAVLELVDGP